VITNNEIEEMRIVRDEAIAKNSMRRYIVSDEEDRQVQKQGNILYFYRKDFLYKKGPDEYSLILLYSKEEK
jgi:hypothetical protein